jgi:type II secretory pathway predicted ATPase ExeA
MYTRYFGLREYPFGLTNDLRFFYNAPLHEEAYTHLRAALNDHKGLVLLTGEPGTGKTTLLQRLVHDLGDSVQIVSLPLAAPTFTEILSRLCEYFALSFSPHDGFGIVLTNLEEHLLRLASGGSNAVLLIDEAQHLDTETLTQLCRLLRLEGPHGKLLQIVLAGHPELEENLTQPEAQLLRHYLASWQRLSPFPGECIEAYIRHRLTVAGCDRPELFTPEAIRTVGLYSHAIPRLINVICDNALLTAFRLDQHIIPLEVILQVAEDLQLPLPLGGASEQQKVCSVEVRLVTPKKLLAALRSSLPPLTWVSVGIVLGWLSATQQFPSLQTASLSHKGFPAGTQLLPSAPEHIVRTSTTRTRVLPSVVPVIGTVFARKSNQNFRALTRSHPPPVPVTSQLDLPSSSPSPFVSAEVARIIEILKHPISPQDARAKVARKGR